MRLSRTLGSLVMIGALALSACSGQGGDNQNKQADLEAAKSGDPISLTVWSWDGTVEAAVEGFEAKYPHIDITVTNNGSSFDEYTALDNAIQAGTGIPDLAMFEYFSIPYFSIPGKLYDLSELGAGDLEDKFVESAWNNVTSGDSVYALPSDYGPAVMFYNAETLKKAGIEEAPATWDDYYEAAKAIKSLGDNYYIHNDNADIFLLQALMWQAGAQPFKVNDLKVEIDFSDEKTQQAVEYWQKLLDEDLVTTDFAAWSDDWNRTLNDGTLATQLIGGWFTSTLPERAPDQAGNWRVAPLPQWAEGENSGAENGGSAFGIPAEAANPEAAYLFLEYFTNGEGLQERVDLGAFVPHRDVLSDEGFLANSNEFFGDQEYNRTLAEASEMVPAGWQYPPFFEWARTTYGDISAPYYTSGKVDLNAILTEWDKQMVAYGNEQGFEVS